MDIIKNIDKIYGVLLLNTNQTYGINKKNKKLLYKFIPYNKQLPHFLVEYKNKKSSFNKITTNKYAIIKYTSYDGVHPKGTLLEIFNSGTELNTYYEYMLSCNNLLPHTNKLLINLIKNNESIIDLIKPDDKIIDRTDTSKWKIYTIDPSNCTDYDDAYSISKIDDYILLSIYISNVPLILDYLNIWDNIYKNVSSIYLPNKKYPMLPNILTDKICSLSSNKISYAFTMDIKIKNDTIYNICYNNCKIVVSENFVYESNKLIKSKNYKLLFKTITSLISKYNYISSINDSHDIIQFMMILMNIECAKILHYHKKGIFRCNDDDINLTPDIPYDKERQDILNIYNNSRTKYHSLTNNLNTSDDCLNHSALNVTMYVHITSPIRRIVDLINITTIQIILKLKDFNKESHDFIYNWHNDIKYINSTTRIINKLQNEFNNLDLCLNNTNNILTDVHDCFIVNVIHINNNENNENNKIANKYTIYIQHLKIFINLVTYEILIKYNKYKCKLYLFQNENITNQKIKAQII
jgi:exoribonuclease R